MEERDHPIFGTFYDSLFELDKWIEEYVYDKHEPVAEDGLPLLGWSKDKDGRYSYWDRMCGSWSTYISEVWPRHFSTSTMLSVELVKKFRISLKPVVTSRNVVVGYSVKSSLMPDVIVVKETLEEAVCLLVVMLTKNMEVGGV